MNRLLVIGGAAVVSVALATVIVRVFDLGSVASSASSKVVPQTDLTEPQPEESSFVTAFVGDSEMFRVIKNEYPREYQAIVQDIERAAPQGPAAVERAAASGVGALRTANAPFLQSATSDSLLAILRANIATHSLIRERAGDRACAAFGIGGPPALGELALDAEVMTQLDSQGAELFRAMASGRRPNVNRDRANDAVWAAVIGYDSLDDQERELIEVFGRQNADNPRFCEALLWFMTRIADAQGPEGDRARAAFAMQLAQS